MREDAVVDDVQHVDGVVVAFDHSRSVVARLVLARTAIRMSALSVMAD